MRRMSSMFKSIHLSIQQKSWRWKLVNKRFSCCEATKEDEEKSLGVSSFKSRMTKRNSLIIRDALSVLLYPVCPLEAGAAHSITVSGTFPLLPQASKMSDSVYTVCMNRVWDIVVQKSLMHNQLKCSPGRKTTQTFPRKRDIMFAVNDLTLTCDYPDVTLVIMEQIGMHCCTNCKQTFWMKFSTLFCRPHHLNLTVTSL